MTDEYICFRDCRPIMAHRILGFQSCATATVYSDGIIPNPHPD